MLILHDNPRLADGAGQLEELMSSATNTSIHSLVEANMLFVAGAFDRFADARAAAEELRDSGFGGETVRVTTNPDNPDGTPGVSVIDEAGKWPGVLEMLVRNVFDLDEQHYLRRQHTEAIRRAGVIVSVPVHDPDKQSIARAVLYRHHAVELGSTPGVAIH